MFHKNRRDRLSDMLNRHDRGVGRRSGVVNVLSNLFRNMVWDLGVTPPRWRWLMDQYVSAEVAHQQRSNTGDAEGKNNKRDRTSIRGNLNKEFLRVRMTWKVFCKGMAFLRLRAFRVVIIALHEDGHYTEHSCLVDYSTPERPIPPEELRRFLELRPELPTHTRVELRPEFSPNEFTPYNPIQDDQQRALQEQHAAQAPHEQLNLFDSAQKEQVSSREDA